MSLLEQDAVRLAAALGDYELVSVTDIGGTEESGHWLTVRDERFGLDYEIGSHADYLGLPRLLLLRADVAVKPFRAASVGPSPATSADESNLERGSNHVRSTAGNNCVADEGPSEAEDQ